MDDRAVVIVGTGLVTPVGLCTRQTVAEVRSGQSRFAESPFSDDHYRPVVMSLIPDGMVPICADAKPREAELTALLAAAASECLQVLDGATHAMPVYMALPERDGAVPLDSARIASDLKGCLKDSGVDASIKILRGRAAGILHMQRLWQDIRDGTCEAALICGADSYAHMHVLASYISDHRVKTDTDSDGFIPGQGASAVLVCSKAMAETRRLKPMAVIHAVGTAEEPGVTDAERPYRGEAVARAFGAIKSRLPPAWKASTLWSSMNGERIWSKELALAQMRHKDLLSEGCELRHPADTLGELGAATSIALVCLAIASPIVHANHCLYASSDDGRVGAVALTVLGGMP